MKIRSILLIVLAMFFLACPAVVDAATYTNTYQFDETYDYVCQNKYWTQTLPTIPSGQVITKIQVAVRIKVWATGFYPPLLLISDTNSFSTGDPNYIAYLGSSTSWATKTFTLSATQMEMFTNDGSANFAIIYTPDNICTQFYLDYATITVTATAAQAPTVTTTSVTNITSVTASGGGNVTSDGGAMVTARGVCWATSSNPATSNSCTTDGTGTGTYTSSITGLAPNTQYHVRAYATNSVGTSYGADIPFSTSTNALLYGNFESSGLWQWSGSDWNQLTPSNPTSMVASGTTLYGTFGSNGIWQWNGTDWNQLTTSNPEAIIVSGTTLYGDFGESGVWQWGGSSWSQLSPSNPTSMLASGTTLYGTFGSNGIWEWNGSAWSQLTPSNPEAIVASGSTLYGDFGEGGIWQWTGSSWDQISASNPVNMVTGN